MQSLAIHDQAKICVSVFSELHPCISAGEEDEVNPTAQRLPLCGREAKIHFECDEVILFAGRPAMSDEVVFAGCEERQWGRIESRRRSVMPSRLSRIAATIRPGGLAT